ncbi:MAG: hypothetical protein AAF362_16575 [Pseudomonadota bacterium]
MNTHKRSILDELQEPWDSVASERDDVVHLNVDRLKSYLWMALGLVLAIGVLREIVIYLIGTETYLKDLRHFQLDAERSIPSWYENLAMAAASALLAIIALFSVLNDRKNTLAWTVLASIFLLMSIDGAVSFHEISVEPLRGALDLGGIFHFSWVILAAPIVFGLGVCFIPFLLRIPRNIALGFIAAGTVFVGGALGTEFICGYFASAQGMDSVGYKITAACQEALESIGLTLFLTVLLSYVALRQIKIGFHSDVN